MFNTKKATAIANKTRSEGWKETRRQRHTQLVQFDIGSLHVRVVRIAIVPRFERGFMGNGAPDNRIGQTRRLRRAHAKNETTSKSKFQATHQILSGGRIRDERHAKCGTVGD